MKEKNRRILMCVFGVITSGIAVGLFKLAAFGVDPFQSLMGGLNAVIPISFGILYIIVNALLLLFSLFADRHYIGLATFINLFLIGYIVDFSHKLFVDSFPAITVFGRCIAFLLAIIILCIGSAFYFTADLGVSTYDAVSLILAHTWKVGPFKYIRIISDFLCVAIGTTLYLLSGGTFLELITIVGIGTILTASCMGPLVDFFIGRLAKPFLERSNTL